VQQNPADPSTQPAPSSSHEMNDPKAQNPVMGEIVSKDAAKNTFAIQTEAGKRLEFKVNATTRFRSEAGTNTELGDLQIGDRVQVQAQPAVGSTPGVALSVQVEPSSKTPKASPGRTTPQSAPSTTPGGTPDSTTSPDPER
jgi:hypothetical protein